VVRGARSLARGEDVVALLALPGETVLRLTGRVAVVRAEPDGRYASIVELGDLPVDALRAFCPR
jgi:hypothetical protein